MLFPSVETSNLSLIEFSKRHNLFGASTAAIWSGNNARKKRIFAAS